MASVRTLPKPILDSLSEMGNPFKQSSFSIDKFFDGDSVSNAELDYEYALKFIYSYQGSSATFNAYRRELERFLQWS